MPAQAGVLRLDQRFQVDGPALVQHSRLLVRPDEGHGAGRKGTRPPPEGRSGKGPGRNGFGHGFPTHGQGAARRGLTDPLGPPARCLPMASRGASRPSRGTFGGPPRTGEASRRAMKPTWPEGARLPMPRPQISDRSGGWRVTEISGQAWA